MSDRLDDPVPSSASEAHVDVTGQPLRYGKVLIKARVQDENIVFHELETPEK